MVKRYAELHCNGVEVRIKSLAITMLGAQTFEKGILTSDSKEFTGNLETEYLDNLGDLSDTRVCLFQLYGTKGIGETAKYCYVAQVSASPSDVGGVDEIVEMTATVIPNTVAKKVTHDYTVTDNGDGTFTVTKASAGGVSYSSRRTKRKAVTDSEDEETATEESLW